MRDCTRLSPGGPDDRRNEAGPPLDVHKKESQISVLAEGGELIERRIRTEAPLLEGADGGS